MPNRIKTWQYLHFMFFEVGRHARMLRVG